MQKSASMTLSETIHQSNKIMVGVLWLLTVLSLSLAGWYETWTVAFCVGLPTACLCSVMARLWPGAMSTRLLIGAGTMVLAGVLIHQAHGLGEIHFSIFVLLAFLLCYRDWAPIVSAAGVITVHHLTFNFLQEWGWGVYVFEHHTGMTSVLLHVTFIVLETALLVYLAVLHKGAAVQIMTFVEQLRGFSTAMQKRTDRVSASMEALGQLSDSMASVSRQIADGAEETVGQTERVSTVATQVNQEVHTVSASAEEMKASIQEIAKNAADAAQVASQAVHETESAQETMAKLDRNSVEIGQVLQVITSIAEQTNLLALNATIEAARAGEAGKGFAVVANEVKELAKQTAEATEDIGLKINVIQTNTQAAVGAMAQVSKIVARINDIANTIAGAVEEQSATTNEIGRSIGTASQGNEEIAHSLSYVAQVTREMAKGVSTFRTNTEELTQQVSELRVLLQQFCHEGPLKQTTVDNGGRGHLAPVALATRQRLPGVAHL